MICTAGMRLGLVRRALVVVGGGIAILATVLILFGSRADAATPSVTITPQSGSASPGASYRSGEAVDVSVGANTLFKPGLRVNILECADPGGTAANLPTSVEDCDGNTIQANTVLIHPDGSIDETQYTIYSLPNQVLGEEPDYQPACDSSHECVLYVGENQEDFSQPKLFSAPFTVAPSSGSTGDTGTTTGATGSIGDSTSASATTEPGTGSGSAGSNASSSTSSPGASVSLQGASSGSDGGDPSTSGSLAYTGVSPALWWMAAVGAALTLVGALGRRASVVGR